MPYRVQTVAVRLLGYYTEFLRGVIDAFLIKLNGDDAGAKTAYLAFMDRFGEHERDIEPYYDHYLARVAYNVIFNSAKAPEM